MERLLKVLSEYERRVLLGLKALKVELHVYRMRGNKGDVYVLCGGVEGIFRFEYNDVEEDIKGALEEACEDDKVYDLVNGDVAPFFITEVTYDVEKLEKIVKWKSYKKLSKTDIGVFGVNVEDSTLRNNDLEDKIVYLHEREPSTNTLSLAKQFSLVVREVNTFIFNGVTMYPSMLTHIDMCIYQYTMGSNKNTTYSTYYELDEHAYTEFLENMGTPKSVGMRVLRYQKKREYYDGFIRLKEHAYAIGYGEQNIIDLINVRTVATKRLQREIGDYIVRMKEKGENINPVKLVRTIFNIINYKVGIDAISWQDSDNNRASKTMKQVAKVQSELTRMEDRLTGLIGSVDKHPSEWILPLMGKMLDSSKAEVTKGLKEYECLETYKTI